MNYQRHYRALIIYAQFRNSKRGVGFHEHHIVPRWQEGDDSPANLVCLTYREHFIAHLLLAKWLGGRAAWNTVQCMCETLHFRSSRLYQRAREETSKAMSGTGNPFYGKTHSQEFIEKQREVGRKNAYQLLEKKAGVHARTKEQMSVDGAKGNKEGKRLSGIKARDNKTGIHAFTREERSLAGKKGAKKGGISTSSQVWKCLACGMLSPAGCIARHQKSSGHKGRIRVT